MKFSWKNSETKKKSQNNKNEIIALKKEITEKESQIKISKEPECSPKKKLYFVEKNDLNEIKTDYVTDNELACSNEDLKQKKLKKRKSSVSSLKSNHKNSLNSILKERSSQRIKNSRKISFGEVQFSY